MALFAIEVKKNIATIVKTEPMTSGSSKVYLVEFHFSPEWNDLARVAVFRSGETTIDVMLDESNICFVPWEVLVDHSVPVEFGVYGTRDGNVVLPTIWAKTDDILEGVATGAEAQPPSPTLYDQLLATLQSIKDLPTIPSGGSANQFLMKTSDSMRWQYPNIYTLAETRIGTWIDGKPLYRRAGTSKTQTTLEESNVVCLSLKNVSVKSMLVTLYDTSESTMSFCRSLPIASRSDGTIIANMQYDPTQGLQVWVRREDFLSKPVSYIVEYTKNNETANAIIEEPVQLILENQNGLGSNAYEKQTTVHNP